MAQIPKENLALWLKADKGVILSGTNVKVWQDQSGHNFHATTTSVTAPQFIANELNGLPVMRFNGVDNAMETVPFQTFPNKRGTVIVALKVSGLGYTSGKGYGTFVSTYFNKGITWQFGAQGPVSIYYDGVGSSGFPIAEMLIGKWSVVTILRDSDSSMRYLRDVDIDMPFRISNNQPDINPLKIASNGRLEVLNGDIAEIIIYGRQLSKSEIAGIQSYLEKKYRLNLQRPDSSRQRWWLYTLFLLPAFGMAIVITKYITQRKLKKQLSELERQREMDMERQRISREMHDDIGAGLTQITLMSESAKNRNQANEKELEDIANTSRKLVGNMSEIIWSLSPENKTLEQLFAYMREQLNTLLEYSGIQYSIVLPENENNILLSNQQRRNILMVTKEIVHNAIKHSKAQNISIKAVIHYGNLEMEITDDGQGFDPLNIHSGNGLKNIRQRVEEMGGRLKISSEKGKGSFFSYSVSLTTT